MAAVIGALRAELSATIAKFQEDMKKAGASVREFATKAEATGKRLQRVGAKMTVALTAPLVAFGVKAVQAATESAQALGQLDAALKSTQHQAGRTLKQLQAQAKALESISTFDDDDILKDVTTNLTKFGNVVGEVFDRAQIAIVDMASRTGDLSGATQIWGRALQDPIRGIALLRRAGVDLGDEQENLIKKLVASGRGIEAQNILLKEAERIYGGAAKALRDATPTAALNQQWRELTEIVGGILVDILPPIIDLLKGIAAAFNSLSPEMQRLTVYTALFVAAIGPLLTIIGTLMRVAAALAPVVTALGAVLGAISAPVWAAVAAVTALVGALLIFWRAVGKLLQGDFTAAWEEAKKTARDMWNDLTAMFAKEPIQAPIEFTADGKPIAPGKTNFSLPKPDEGTRGTFPDEISVTHEVDLSEKFRNPLSAEMQRLVELFRESLLAPIRERREAEQAQEAVIDLREQRGDFGVVSEEALRRQEIARDLFEKQIATEERLAELETQRHEAELRGDTEAMTRLSNIIVEQQRLLDLVKETTVEQVEQHEKEKEEQKNKKTWEQQAREAFEGFFKDIGDGFKQLAREGGDVFEMLRMALREALFKAFVDPAIDAAVDALQQLIKGLFKGIGNALASSFAGGFAEGGYVPPNQWAVVGENGPETVFGGKSGLRVFSNEDSRQMVGGGQTVNQVFNIRTADTNSFQRTQRQIARTAKRQLQEA